MPTEPPEPIELLVARLVAKSTVEGLDRYLGGLRGMRELMATDPRCVADRKTVIVGRRSNRYDIDELIAMLEDALSELIDEPTLIEAKGT